MDESNDIEKEQAQVSAYLDIIDQKAAVLHAALIAYSVDPDPALLEGLTNDALALRSVAHEAWQRALIEQAQTDKGALAGIGRAGINDIGGLLAATPGPEDWIH